MMRQNKLLLLFFIIILAVILPATVASAVGNYGVNESSSAYTSPKNPFAASYTGECTWYAYGRVYEKHGFILDCRGNAREWADQARKLGFNVDTNPSDNSIAVWTSNASGNGHVAYVERQQGNLLYLSEYNYYQYHVYCERTLNLSSKKYQYTYPISSEEKNGTNPTFYIHLDLVGAMDVTTRPDNHHMRIYGWAYDRLMPDATIQIHAYFGGEAGTGAPGRVIGLANNYRKDFKRNVGYDFIFDTSGVIEDNTRTPIYIYAVNPQSDKFIYLGHKNTYPIGYIDSLSGRDGAVYIRGWVFDPDAAGYYPDIHVYVGAPAGTQGKQAYVFKSEDYQSYRNDVAAYCQEHYNYCPISDYHGFEIVLPVNEIGSQDIYVYAIDNEQGSESHNPLLPLASTVSTRTVTISPAESTYTITYTSNYTNVENLPNPQVCSGTVNLSNVIPRRLGYTFTGWTTQVFSGNAEYAAGASFTGTEDIVLYATWQGNTYTVYFDPNGGTCQVTDKTVINGARWYGDLPIPSRMGYSFTGWYTERNGGRRIISDTTVSLADDQTLYAQWEKLSELILPADLTFIGEQAFYGCAEQYVEIPDTVTCIGSQAFGFSSNLCQIRIHSTTEEIAPDAFEGHIRILTIFCEANSAAHNLAVEKEINYVLVNDE